MFSYQQMVVPVDTTVTLDINAQDVAHSWWIPKLGGKFDAIPGYTNYTWFKIPGKLAGTVFTGQCAELCGRNHANMTATVRAVTPPEYEKWLDQRKADIKAADDAAAKQRKQIEKQTAVAPFMAATTEQALAPVPQIVARRVEPERTGWTSWVTTTDHKRIGIMYLVLTFVFFILGGTEALLMRLQLSQANNTLLDPKTYNELFTMHGTTMIFLFVVPIMAGFGNYFVPLMIGARDMAYPKLNALSFWLLVAGGLVFYGSIFFNPPECGWTCYPPLSSKAYLPNGGVDAWIFLIHLTGLSSLVGAINFYATIANMRAPGMGWGRLPLFVWSILTYAILLIVALPVIAARGDDAAHRPPLRDALLRRVQRRLAAALAAPVLVLRAPRGLHHGAAGLRDHLRGPARLRPQADLRLQGDRGGHGADRLPRLPRVGAPHVLHAEPDLRARLLHARLVPDRRARRA